MNEPVAPPWMEQGQLTNPLPKFVVLASFRLVVPGGFGQAHQETSPFGLDQCRDEFPRHGTFLGGRHRFFWITSFMASISRRCWPAIRKRRAFSFSS